MTSKVIKGHIRSHLSSKIGSFLHYFVLNLILSKLNIDINIIKTEIFHEMRYDFKDLYRSSNHIFFSYLKITFSWISFFMNSNLIKTICIWLLIIWRHFFSHKMKDDLKGLKGNVYEMFKLLRRNHKTF